MNNNTIFFMKNDEIDDQHDICCYSGDKYVGYTIHELYDKETEEGKEYIKTNKIPYRFATEMELFSYVRKYVITIIKIDSEILQKELSFDVYDGDNKLVYQHNIDRKTSLVFEILDNNEQNYFTILNILRDIDVSSINYYRLKNLCDNLNRLNTKILLNVEK